MNHVEYASNASQGREKEGIRDDACVREQLEADSSFVPPFGGEERSVQNHFVSVSSHVDAAFSPLFSFSRWIFLIAAIANCIPLERDWMKESMQETLRLETIAPARLGSVSGSS